MNKNFKKSIEELEEIVKVLHRSASNLDDAIERIKFVADTESNNEYLYMYAKNELDHRKAKRKYAGYDELGELEDDIWERLTTTILNEES